MGLTNRHTTVAALVLCSIFPSRNGRSDELEAWARASTNRVRTIDPSDTDFSDLNALGKRLRAVDVVLLGESLHSDGATDLARARLTRFLHERLGFDVLAMETSLFYGERMEEVLSSPSGTGAEAKHLLAEDFARMSELRPLFDYLKSTRSTQRVMHAAGIDPQLNRGPDELYAWVLGAVDRANVLEPDARARIAATLARYPKPAKFRPLTRIERDADRGAWQTLVDAVRSVPVGRRSTGSELALLERCGLQMLALYDWHADTHADEKALVDWNEHAAANNVRDRTMADNVRWLRESRYPGAKIVVWAANFHIMKAAHDLERAQFTGLHPMGEVLAAPPRSRTYAIAFTSGGGRTGWPNEADVPVPAPEPDSLERALTGLDASFVLADLGKLSRRKRYSNALGYTPILGDWSQVFDCLFFIRTMTPTHAAASGD